MASVAQGMAAFVMLVGLFVLANTLDTYTQERRSSLAGKPVCQAPVEVGEGDDARLGCADEPVLAACRAQALDRLLLRAGGCQRTPRGMRPAWQRLTGHKLDVNAVTAQDLRLGPGLGTHLAQALIAERDANGLFLDPNDLTRVPGIGPAKARILSTWLTVLR